MAIFLILIPLAFLLGLAGLGGLLWALNSGQYEDMEGHAARILKPEEDEQ
jgi:cbb3-type cytochrome oxidase maturation protein